MKTTIDQPDHLLIAAKKKAAELSRPLRSLLEEGLRARTAVKDGPQPAAKRKIRWVCVQGGLPPGLELEDRARMHDWLGRKP